MLVRKIRATFTSIPIFLGGISISKKEKIDIDATICKNGLTHDILRELKLIKK
jgi:hypothetical protein